MNSNTVIEVTRLDFPKKVRVEIRTHCGAAMWVELDSREARKIAYLLDRSVAEIGELE